MSQQPEEPALPLSTLMCQQMVDLLSEYLSGDLDAQTRTVFETHLHNCRDCHAFLQTFRLTMQATRALRYEDIPSDLQERLYHTLQSKIAGVPPS